jgi:hypothetical protein
MSIRPLANEHWTGVVANLKGTGFSPYGKAPEMMLKGTGFSVRVRTGR